MRKKVLDFLSTCFVGFSDPCIFNSNLKTCLHAIFDYRTSRIPFEISTQWTIYSATIFLEKCRKVVLEKWFHKLSFFFWSTTFLEPEKRQIYGIKPSFFLVNHFSRTRFLEPDFTNQIFLTTFLHLSRKVVTE